MQEQKLLKRKRKATNDGNKSSLASICIDLAELYCEEGRYEDAIEEYIIVADVYKELGKQLDYARANRMIGEAYTHLTEFEKALRYQQIHLNVAREQNDKLEEQRALATIGHTHLTSYLNNNETTDKTTLNLAYKAFMKSLLVCESLADTISKHEHKDMMARLLANLGVVQECQGNYDRGIELVQKSINICKSHDLFEQLERGYTLLGSLHVRKKEYNKAIHQYNLALEVAGRLKNKVALMCASLSSKADILIKLADFHGAKVVLLKAYKLKNPCVAERENIERTLKIVAAMCYTEDSLLMTSDTDYKTKKRLYEKLGDGSCSLKNYSNAIEYYQKMLEAAQSNGDSGLDLSPCYISLAETYRDNEQFDMAIKFFKKEYNISKINPKDGVNTLLNIADCMEAAANDFFEIESIYNQARADCVSAGDKYMECRVLSRYITALRKRERCSQATQLEREFSRIGLAAPDSDSEHSQEQATPDIGDDISINDITDVSDESDTENSSKPRAARKRSKGLVVKRNNKGETQLHTACIAGNDALVRRLLDQGHPVNVRDNCGWLPIHEACICGHLGIVEMLIEKGASINDRGGTLCNGMTPLHDAASNGHLEIMQLLLDKGASSIVKNDIGEMPLHIFKKWRAANQLEPADQSLCNNLLERLTQDVQKLGHGNDIVVTGEQNTALVSEGDEQITTRRQARQSISKNDKAVRRGSIGNLRKNLDFDEDLDAHTSKSVPVSDGSESDNSDQLVYTRKESHARDEYKRVMENLRHPLQEENIERKRKSSETRRRPAYLEPDEVGDDWLEDDLGVNQQKKRKTSSADALMNTIGTRASSNRSLRCGSSSSLKSKDSFNDDFEIPDEFFDSDLNEIQMENARNINDLMIADNEFRAAGRSSTVKKRKTQSSLMDSGFTRHRSISPTNVINTNVVNTQRKHQSKLTDFGHGGSIVNTERHVSASQLSNTHLSNVFNSEPILTVDVRIDGKLYRVPVPATEIHTCTIKWLADEATKRYSRKEFLKPELELETKNGAVLAEDDFISILFSPGTVQAEEVHARILKWNLPPLSERYTEACINANIVPNENLSVILQEVSPSLNLSDMGLQKANMAPLCKALNRQINLHHLNLSGNFMQNESVQLLCLSLPSLDNLTVLNLSLNQLSSESLKFLAEMFTQSDKSLLENLVSLDLSYNSLGNESLKYLGIITRYLKLQTLTLVNVDFTSEIFDVITNRNVSLCLDYILNFDISYNQLGKQQITTFLSWIKPQTVEMLNISSNVRNEEGVTKEVVNWLQIRGEEGNLHLKSLDLSRCHATDAEIYDFLRVLLSANNFKTLNLGYNEELTSLSLRRLLQHHPSFVALDLTGCRNILRYFNDCTENTWSSVKLKNIKLSINEGNSEEKEKFMSIWKNAYKDKAKIVCALRGFIELSISD